MSNEPSVTVKEGTWVKISGFEPDEDEVFHIVPAGRVNPIENEIPSTSPLAQTIRGAKAGDKFKWNMPTGMTELTVLEVGEL